MQFHCLFVLWSQSEVSQEIGLVWIFHLIFFHNWWCHGLVFFYHIGIRQRVHQGQHQPGVVLLRVSKAMMSRARWCWVVSRLGSKLASGAPGGPATWTTNHGDLWGISGIAESVEQNWHWAQVTYIHNHIVPQGYDFISFDIDDHILHVSIGSDNGLSPVHRQAISELLIYC